MCITGLIKDIDTSGGFTIKVRSIDGSLDTKLYYVVLYKLSRSRTYSLPSQNHYIQAKSKKSENEFILENEHNKCQQNKASQKAQIIE